MCQSQSGQRRRRGLAVRARDHDRPRPPEEVIAHGFGQRAVADLAIQDLFELGVAAGDRIADHHQVDVRADVLGAIALERGDALIAQEIAHRRIDVLVRSPDIVAAALEEAVVAIAVPHTPIRWIRVMPFTEQPPPR